MQHHSLSHAHFETILTTREMDLDSEPPATLEALISYAEGTSSALFLLALEAVSLPTEESKKAAHHLGIAWALLGTIRALRFGRVMIPESLQNKEGIKRVAMLAEEHLGIVYGLRKSIPREALPVFLHATMAKAHLKKLRNFDYDIARCDTENQPVRMQVRLLVRGIMGSF